MNSSFYKNLYPLPFASLQLLARGGGGSGRESGGEGGGRSDVAKDCVGAVMLVGMVMVVVVVLEYRIFYRS